MALVRARRLGRVVLYVESQLDPTGPRGSPAALGAAVALSPVIRRGRIKIIGWAELNLYQERIARNPGREQVMPNDQLRAEGFPVASFVEDGAKPARAGRAQYVTL